MLLLSFEAHGPFDDDERALITEVVRAVEQLWGDDAPGLAAIAEQLGQLHRLSEVLAAYPTLFDRREGEGVRSFVRSLTRATAANMDMVLPHRALVSRALVMGEVNFYRSLRALCLAEPRSHTACAECVPRLDERLCFALYTRLAETVLLSIASDNSVEEGLRNRAGLSLGHLWEDATYRVATFFPVLEATWEARRRVPAVLGTLMGTSEMFGLLEAGCDEAFIDYLSRPDHTEDEAQAFREFLFGVTTERLARMERRLPAAGTISRDALSEGEEVFDACCGESEADPALAMYEFFRSRHLQASARRHADLPGPKRTAEEYVMLYHLEHEIDIGRLSAAPYVLRSVGT